jgi:cyclase
MELEFLHLDFNPIKPAEMKTIKIAGTILFLVFSSIMLSAQERETTPVTLEKVSESVYQIRGGSGSNGGVIVGENGVLVIDAKMNEESVNQTIEAIQELSDKAIKYLVNTHSDGDHIMGNRYFPKSVTFIAHENCRDDFFKVNFGRESDWGEAEFYPFTPSLSFTENMDVWLGKDKVELQYFGVGHTTGDIVVYFYRG